MIEILLVFAMFGALGAVMLSLSRCCFCGFCVEACPEDAIRMDTGILEWGRLGRDDLRIELWPGPGRKI